MPKSLTLSVGIPAFNQGEYLEETIVSLMEQTRPPDEIVISDQYSTDSTPDVIAKYAKYVRGIKPPPGVSLAEQYSFTLSSQTSDWISLLSSDDVAKPNFCEVLMRGAGRRDDAVVVRAGWENMDEHGKHISGNYLLSVKAVTMPPATLREQCYGPKIGFSSFAIRRTAFATAGPILPSIESLADWALWLQLAPLGSFIYEADIISRYRVFLNQDKFRARLGMWLRDEQRIFYELMPRSARQAKMTDIAWIDQASRTNFIRYLCAASEHYPAGDREPIVPLFADWAPRVGANDQLAIFAKGGRIGSHVTAVGHVKNMLRPMVHTIYSSLKGG